jgi:nucleotide-binding universal stress UspA family protein
MTIASVASKRAIQPLRILAVVDGSERTNRIIEHVITTAQGRDATEVVVLNVQDKRDDARLRGYQSFKQSEVDDRLINDVGGPIVNTVSRWLDKVGIGNLTRVKIGDPVANVMRCARDDRCDVIVVGDAGPGKFRRWLVNTTGLSLGSSVAARLAMVASTPVVIVK